MKVWLQTKSTPPYEPFSLNAVTAHGFEQRGALDRGGFAWKRSTRLNGAGTNPRLQGLAPTSSSSNGLE